MQNSNREDLRNQEQIMDETLELNYMNARNKEKNLQLDDFHNRIEKNDKQYAQLGNLMNV